MQAHLALDLSRNKPDKENNHVGTVAYLLDSFPNVSETFVSNEINELIKLGWDVKIFALHRPRGDLIHESAMPLVEGTVYLPRPVEKKKILTSFFSLAKHSPKRVFSILLQSKLLPGPHYKWTAKQAIYVADEIRKTKCERIHIHFASEAARYGLFVSKFLNIPMTLTVHSPLGKNESDKYTLSVIGKHANAILTVSKFNKIYICTTHELNPEKVYVNPNGIQDSVFKLKPLQQRIDGRILTVARLHPDKGICYAISAASILKKAGRDFEWIIVGDGPEREEMQAQIDTLGLQQHVKLVGFQPTSRVVQELDSASIFALTSVSEAQPVVYLEAMATGTPIVGTDIPGVSETVINGETGFLVPIGNAEALATKIIELLDDELLRQKFSHAAEARIKSHYLLKDRVLALSNIWKNSSIDK